MATAARSFDAFLSHNSADKPLVKEIGRWLADEAKLRVWLDEWNLIPGEPWQEGLEEALDDSKCCVVFLGSSGIGAWQNEEMRAALAERVDHGDLRVLPVLLPGADRPRKESELPAFLRRLTWVRFGADWKDDTALHRLLCGIRGIPPGRRDGDVATVCPYRGLEVFRPEDRRFFFGRDALVERLLDYLEGHRFLAVIGPSGSGKSSVVQAGLVPELDDGETLIEILTPRERPLEELAFALRRCFPEGQAPPTEELLGRLRRSAEALHLIARELADAAGARRIFLAVDQFEELFTQTADDEERRRFVANLLAAVERSGPTSVILTMRSDFLGRCALDPDLNVFVEEHLFQVGPMSREEQESAITGPARLVGLVFEDGLVEEILDDVKGSPGELPLLQHALLELYDRRAGGALKHDRDGARLTLKTYQQIGRVEGALTRRAEEEFEKLDDVEQETLRRMFIRLVQAGEGTEDSRRRASREELLAIGEDPRIADFLIAQWTDARLLTTWSDEVGFQVEFAHESLIRRWQRLWIWIQANREETRWIDRLSQSAYEWHRAGRQPDYLFRGAQLARWAELAKVWQTDITELERAFVEASKARQQEEENAQGSLAQLAKALGLTHLQKKLEDRANAFDKLSGECETLTKTINELEDRKRKLEDSLGSLEEDSSLAGPRIFISYARKDERAALNLYARLRAEGFRPWIDQHNLKAGMEWERAIHEEMPASDFIIVCLSGHSVNKRGYFQREMRIALDLINELPPGRVFIIPVRLEPCAVPREVSKYQYSDLFEMGNFEKLARSILIEWNSRRSAETCVQIQG